MVHIGIRQCSDRCFAPIVFDMTSLAALGAGQPGMQAAAIYALQRHRLVALLAAIIRNAVKRRMTVTALRFEFSMRYITT